MSATQNNNSSSHQTHTIIKSVKLNRNKLQESLEILQIKYNFQMTHTFVQNKIHFASIYLFILLNNLHLKKEVFLKKVKNGKKFLEFPF